MNKLDVKLKEIKLRGKIGLMTHVVIGYPSLKDTLEIVKTMSTSGADIIELQIPFSDPLADGPTIMKACEKSLENGTKVKDAFTIMKTLSREVSAPLVFMCYYNTIFAYGVEKFCSDAESFGAVGLIVPDMPLDEEPEEHFMFFCKKYNLHAIRVISPASTTERLQKNAKVATGFVYFTSHQGTTGAATGGLDPMLVRNLENVKKYFKIPIAVGFGISKKEHLLALQGRADIAVVGSALINVINSSGKQEMISNIKKFISELKK